tara:strand:+ start:170 stop:358 length:189 start_codon:yes stop_codon:yes gene_type:complete
MNKELRKIADEISFRLLATRSHEDYEWLYNTLKDFRYEKVKPKHWFWNLFTSSRQARKNNRL